jgi:hypothetical protein
VSYDCSHVLTCLGNVPRCIVLRTGSVADRLQVGGVALDELLGAGEKFDEVLSGIVGRWATDVGGVLLVLLFTSAGEGHLKLGLPVKWLVFGGCAISSRKAALSKAVD